MGHNVHRDHNFHRGLAPLREPQIYNNTKDNQQKRTKTNAATVFGFNTLLLIFLCIFVYLGLSEGCQQPTEIMPPMEIMPPTSIQSLTVLN